LSAGPQLILPKHVGDRRYKRAVDPRRVANAKKAVGTINPRVQLKEHPGRPHGMPHGSWVWDLTCLRKVVLLCFACQHKFDHKRNDYYMDGRHPFCTARCDGCRRLGQAKMYIHNSALAEPGGRLMSGQVVTPV